MKEKNERKKAQKKNVNDNDDALCSEGIALKKKRKKRRMYTKRSKNLIPRIS